MHTDRAMRTPFRSSLNSFEVAHRDSHVDGVLVIMFLSFILCMCMQCVHVCVHMSVWVCLPVCVLGWGAGSGPWVSSSITLYPVSVMDLEFTITDSRCTVSASQPAYLCLQCLGCRCMWLCSTFEWMLRIKARLWMLYPLTRLPTPKNDSSWARSWPLLGFIIKIA